MVALHFALAAGAAKVVLIRAPPATAKAVVLDRLRASWGRSLLNGRFKRGPGAIPVRLELRRHGLLGMQESVVCYYDVRTMLL